MSCTPLILPEREPLTQAQEPLHAAAGDGDGGVDDGRVGKGGVPVNDVVIYALMVVRNVSMKINGQLESFLKRRCPHTHTTLRLRVCF